MPLKQCYLKRLLQSYESINSIIYIKCEILDLKSTFTLIFVGPYLTSSKYVENINLKFYIIHLLYQNYFL